MTARTGRAGQLFLLALLLSVMGVLLEVSYQAVLHPPFQVSPSIGLSFWVYLVTGLGFAIRAWLLPDLDRRSRRAWGVMAVGYLFFLASASIRVNYPLGIGFPSPADILRLLFMPFMLVGLLLLPLRTRGRQERNKAWLDTGIVGIASVMLVWFVETLSGGAASEQMGAGAVAAAVAYPVSDLILIFGAGIVLLRGGADSARIPATLLGAGMLFLVLGDLLLGYELAHGSGGQSSPWQWACWIVAHFLLAVAPVVQCRRARRHRLETEEAHAHGVRSLPYLAIGLGYLLLLIAVLDSSARVIGLVVGAIGMTAVAVARQIVAMRENHDLAITDPLTGLFNRRYFYDRLRLAIARSARNGQTIAVLLIDLNDFKRVNDTLGHDAGDQLLLGLAAVLRRNVLGMDAVGRLGGDEFAVVLHNVGSAENAEAVVGRIVADMDTPIMVGDALLQPWASIGIALSTGGDVGAEELLRRADMAMYRAKKTARQTTGSSFASYLNDAGPMTTQGVGPGALEDGRPPAV